MFLILSPGEKGLSIQENRTALCFLGGESLCLLGPSLKDIFVLVQGADLSPQNFLLLRGEGSLFQEAIKGTHESDQEKGVTRLTS